ncbi:MAG: twin-arginine translocation signal domain-containing protein [Pseudomonadota bacterium]
MSRCVSNKRHMSRRDILKQGSGLVAGAALAGTLVTPAHSALYNQNVTELVQFIEGDLPILLVAPHGGNELVFGIPARTNITRPVANFTFYGAVWTYEICLAVSRTLQRLSGGKKPYMVLNLAHRRYLDVNREDSDAYEVTLNAPRIYWEYHDMVREFVNQMNIIYRNPILIELTGHRVMEDLIVRRTLNGKSVTRMQQRVGENALRNNLAAYEEKINILPEGEKKAKAMELLERDRIVIAQNSTGIIDDSAPLSVPQPESKKREKALKRYIKAEGEKSYAGPLSLIGEIKSRGYNIDPDIGIADIEMPQTTAGDFTLDRYGSHQEVGGMDAMQLVIGRNYRKTKNYQQTGRDIGNALWNFMKTYDILE